MTQVAGNSGCEISPAQREALHSHVTTRRRSLNVRLDLRWLNLSVRPIHVVEVYGSIVLEGPSEARDQLLIRIPEIQKYNQQEDHSNEHDQ